MTRRILVTGAVGQVGTELTPLLRERHGADRVVASGHRTAAPDSLRDAGPFVTLDATDAAALAKVVRDYDIGTIYHLATILSANGEQDPGKAWRVNIESLRAVLDLAVERKLDQVFWPSSIAVFGPTTPRDPAPQRTVLEPTTMYGVTKLAGEALCLYYHHKYGLDVRGIRYPGLVTYKAFSGGGTTDYSVEMFFEAKRRGSYACFVRADTVLPLMYMDDAVRATVELMEADGSALTVRTSYNIGADRFTAGDLAEEVKRRVPGFTCTYEPDFRQAIADSWPQSLEDDDARRDWGWRPRYDLGSLTEAMLAGVGLEAAPR